MMKNLLNTFYCIKALHNVVGFIERFKGASEIRED